MSWTTAQRSPTDGYEKELATLNGTPQETDTLVNYDWDSEPAKKRYFGNHNQFHWIYIIPILVVLTSPWIFFGLVKHRGGVQFPHRPSRVNDHPKLNNFIFTGVAIVFNSVIGLLFGKSLTILAKRWIAHKGTDIFGFTFFTGLKRGAIPWKFHWEWQYIKLLITRHLFWVMMLYMIVFHFISTSSISALITPGLFTRNATLQGQELDFGASGDVCATWFQENALGNVSCGWAAYKGMEFTTCLGENQLMDVLESGRSNMFSLQPNTSISVNMPQLGLPFFGPIRGVLPNGPNGVRPFDTLSSDSSPFNASAETGLTYNYTLQLQGLSSSVSCAYMPDTPIKYGQLLASPTEFPWWTYNGTCDGQEDFLNTTYSVPPGSPHLLGFWACRSGQSYTVYLTGNRNRGYAQIIGNISCTLSHIVPAIFPVEYVGRTGLFSSQPHTSTSAGTSSELVSLAIKSLGFVIQGAQGMDINLFADSVLTVSAKTHGSPYTNLRLFEAMIQGIIEYEATYIRMLYTRNSSSAPQTCFRTIDGFVEYQVIGWFVNPANGFLLIPLTIFNVIVLLILVGPMLIGKEKKMSTVDPTSQDIFIFASNQYVPVDPNDPPNWPIKIEPGPTVGTKEGFRFKD